MYRCCKCPAGQVTCRCSSSESQSDSDIVCPGEPLGAACGCCHCDKPFVKGKFGLAYVIETPQKKFCTPLGWQVEFEDTPSRIADNCKKMMRWVNCPPLGDCNNMETNFCAYPEDCAQLLTGQKYRTTKKDKVLATCCIQEPKKNCKSPLVNETGVCCCSKTREPVCIICENCRVNAQGYCKLNAQSCCAPKVLCCCSKSNRKSPRAKYQDENQRCKCCTKQQEPLEKCCKCCRPKLHSNFFRESLDKKYRDQQCCCVVKYCTCDDFLDYIPKREVRVEQRNRSKSPNDMKKDVQVLDKRRERSQSPKFKKNEQQGSDTYKLEYKPVLKENKATKTDKTGVSATGKDKELNEISQKVPPVETRPAPSENLIDELQKRLKEKYSEVAAPKNKTEYVKSKPTSIEQDVTKSRVKNDENTSKADEGDERNVASQAKSGDNNEQIQNTNKGQTKDEPQENKSESEPTVKSDNNASQLSVLQRIKEAHKRQLEEIKSKAPSTNTNNFEQNSLEQEREIKKTDYEGEQKPLLERIKEAHQKQIHEIHPENT